jgi:protein SCO1/2
MQNKLKYIFILLTLPLLFFLWFYLSKTEKAPLRYLPYLGPKNYSDIKDTVYHSIPDFNFIDQDGKTISQADLKGKFYVTEYFFTTCKSICPIMNTNLIKVYKEFKDTEEFLILSHTVDPETDSVSVLKEYATQHGVNDDRWKFVTGDKKQLYGVARKGYLLNAEEGDGGKEDFIHTQNFALIDKEHHIRGFYDGTDSLEIVRLMQDIKILKKEYEYLENGN